MDSIFFKSYFGIVFTLVLYSSEAVSQDDIDKDKLVQLSTLYTDNIFGSITFSYALIDSSDISLFVQELLSSNNDLLNSRYQKVPSTQNLMLIYCIDALHQNRYRQNKIDEYRLIDSLYSSNIERIVLIDNYYRMYFTSIGNKNKPFDLGTVNFELNQLGLSNDAEKGVFYFRCMEFCCKQIRGYLALPNKEAVILETINLFPMFNGKKYFEYEKLDFDDFEIELFNDRGKTSYKEYFVNNLYTTLLIHFQVLYDSDLYEDCHHLIENSVMLHKSLWQYCSKEKVDILHSILESVSSSDD